MVRKRYISEAVAVVTNDDGDFGPVSTAMDVYDAFSGGTKQTNLLDSVGNAITQAQPIAANGYQCVFDGPDGVTGALYLNDPNNIRHIVFPSDLGDRLSAGGTVLTDYSQIAGLPNYPTSFPAAAHDHDTRYYTMAQIDSMLAAARPPEVLTWNVPGQLAVSTDDVVPIYNDGDTDRTIVAVRTQVGTAPATTAILVDLNVNGLTAFATQGNRPSIAASQLSSGKKTGMSTTVWPVGGTLAPAIDQVGSSTSPGADLIVQVLVN